MALCPPAPMAAAPGAGEGAGRGLPVSPAQRALVLSGLFPFWKPHKRGSTKQSREQPRDRGEASGWPTMNRGRGRGQGCEGVMPGRTAARKSPWKGQVHPDLGAGEPKLAASNPREVQCGELHTPPLPTAALTPDS